MNKKGYGIIEKMKKQSGGLMKIYSFLFMMLLIASIVAGMTTYVAYGIYGSKKLLYLIPLFGFFPFITSIIGRIYGRGSIERYLGHFLFYYNYIAIFSIAIALIQIFSLLFGKNFFEYIRENIFHLFQFHFQQATF